MQDFDYSKITNEIYPRIFYTRHIEKDGSKYFGPFPDVEYIKRMIEIVTSEYKIRKCNLKNFNNVTRTCVNYDIGLCSGPCKNKISHSKYLELVEKATEFLEGNHKEVIDSLKEKMNRFAEEFKFEEAAKIRDDINYINSYKEK